jgi:hypothetical protein
MNFGYELVRLWARPAEELLRADLGVFPLAVLGRLPETLSLEDGLAFVAHSMAERLEKEAPLDKAKKLLTDAYLLTGLRVRRTVGAQIFRGVRVMEESDTYLAIVDEGREKQVKKDIINLGKLKLGALSQANESTLLAITDLERLERLLMRLFDAVSWQDLLDTP